MGGCGRVPLGLGFGGRGLGVLFFPRPLFLPRIPRRSIFLGGYISMKWRTMVGWFLFRGVLGCFEGFWGDNWVNLIGKKGICVEWKVLVGGEEKVGRN